MITIALIPLLLATLIFGELQYVQIWFRHGERGPMTKRFPQEKKDFGSKYPYGKAQLTKKGMEMEYELGKNLRAIYDGFLSTKPDPDEIKVYHDATGRTSTSAQLVLAGLYPPKEDEIWNEEVRWRPVETYEKEIILLVWEFYSFIMYSYKVGPVLDTPCSKLWSPPEMQSALQIIMKNLDHEVLKVLEQGTGHNVRNPYDYLLTIDALRMRYLLNDTRIPLPDWASIPFMEKVLISLDYIYGVVMDLEKETIGALAMNFFIEAFDEALVQEIQNTNRRKHDSNIFAVTRTLRIPYYENHLVHFGGYVAMELHKEQDDHLIRVFVANSYKEKRKEIVIPNCDPPCTLATFKEIFGKTRLVKNFI